jgi:tetratricopeptide (TPR) repeat protein
MSRVFLAEEIALGRRVVVKVCSPELAAVLDGERFEREVRVSARLQHPHIVAVLSAGRVGKSLFYIMPFIDGETLRARLSREVELPVNEATRLTREIADALAYAHARGFVHRDIKPENILLSHGHAMLADFGIVKALADASGDTLTATGLSLGTPLYMAPEQAVADPHLDHRADLYSLGAVAYEMLAGTPPFERGTPQALIAAHLSGTAAPLESRRPAVPPPLAAIVHRCLEKRAADRFADASALVAALDALTTAPISASARAIPRAAGRFQDRPWPMARVLAAFAIGGALALSVAWIVRTVAGLPDWFVAGAAALLILGLPVVVAATVAHNHRLAGPEDRGPLPRLVPRKLTLRRAIVGGIAAFSMLGVGTGSYMGMRTMGIGAAGTLVARGKLTARERLIIADFENSTRDSLLGPALTEAFRVDLAQSRLVSPAEPDYLRRALTRMQRPATTPITSAIAREIAQREGIKAVVEGEIQPVASALLVSAQIVSAETGEVLAVARETARDSTHILDAVDRVSKRLRERIGESLRAIRANPPLADATTGSLEALRKYSQGLRMGDAGDERREIQLMEEAVAADSGFAMAWRRLGTQLFNRAEQLDRAEEAITRAFRLRGQLSFRERRLTESSYYSDVAIRPESSAAALESLLREHPDDAWAINNLGVEYTFAGDRDRAAQMYRRAIVVEPQTLLAHTNLFAAQLALGQFDSAATTLRTIRASFPLTASIDELDVQLRLARRDYAAAEPLIRDQLQRHRDDADAQNRLHMLLAGTLMIRGKLAEADRALTASADLYAARGRMGAALTEHARRAIPLAMYLGDSAAARARLDAAFRAIPIDRIRPRERPMARLIAAAWSSGDASRAASLLNDFERHPGAEPGRVRRYLLDYHRARVLMMTDSTRIEATAVLRRSVSGPCAGCAAFSFAQLFDAQGVADSAIAYLEQWAVVGESEWAPGSYNAWQPIAYLRMAELYEARSDSGRAAAAYERFAELWRDADAVLQPRVREAKRRAAALRSDRGG